jgi:hypothetical protein
MSPQRVEHNIITGGKHCWKPLAHSNNWQRENIGDQIAGIVVFPSGLPKHLSNSIIGTRSFVNSYSDGILLIGLGLEDVADIG